MYPANRLLKDNVHAGLRVGRIACEGAEARQ